MMSYNSSYSANLLGALGVALRDEQIRVMSEASGCDANTLSVLLAVFTRTGSSVGDVAITAGLTHSGAVRVIDRLTTLGLVMRSVGEDRRFVALQCTDEGKAVARGVFAARRERLQEMVDALSSDDRTSLERIIATLLGGLPVTQADAWRICRLCEHACCCGSDCPVGRAVA